MLLVLVCVKWYGLGESNSLHLGPKPSDQPMTQTRVKMVDAARIARASLRLQRSVSTCFTKRPWQVPRESHPAELVLEAIPSLRAWDP